MKLLKRLSNGYRLIRYLLILCAIAYLWWEGESYVAAGILTVLMVGVPLWRVFRAEARDRQSVDCVSGGIRIENAAGSSREISAWDVGGLRVTYTGLELYDQDGRRITAVPWRTKDAPAAGRSALWALVRPRFPDRPVQIRVSARKRRWTAASAGVMMALWLLVGAFMWITDQLADPEALKAWLVFLAVLAVWNGWRCTRDFRRRVLAAPDGVTVIPSIGRKRQLPWEQCVLIWGSGGVPMLPGGTSLEGLDDVLPLMAGICAQRHREEIQ